MSATLDVVITVAAALGALVLLGMSLAGMMSARRLRVRASRVSGLRALRPGPVEVRGTVRAAGPPLVDLEGRACVSRSLEVHFLKQAHRGRIRLLGGREDRRVEVSLEDATGRCALAFDQAALVVPRREVRWTVPAWREREPDTVARLLPGTIPTAAIELAEETLADGAAVVVTGVAAATGVEPSGQGYRGVAERFTLTGDATHPLVVSSGRESPARRALLGPVVAAGVALLVLGLATALAWSSHTLAAALGSAS